MNDESRAAFNGLKPYCIELSAVTLRAPERALLELDKLYKALNGTEQSAITQDVANYIFFPLKPLLAKGIPEETRVLVFKTLSWLLGTQWFVPGGEMSTQLIRLYSTLLAQAGSEELRCSIYQAFIVLFEVAEGDTNALSSRPTLAYIVTTALEESSGMTTQLAALQALLALFKHLDGDAIASFLPGVMSSLAKSLVKHNQRSVLITAGLSVLQSSITRAMDGTTTEFRSSSWQAATTSQLVLALGPVLSRLAENDHDAVRDRLITFCTALLAREVATKVVVETLLRIKPESIPQVHQRELADLLDGYADAMPRILQGADEDRKIHMLESLARALPLLSESSKQILCGRLVYVVRDFVQFTEARTLMIAEDERPHEPDIAYLSSQSRDALRNLLRLCSSQEVPLESPELFWIAQNLGQDTYRHALSLVGTVTNTALQSILTKAQQMGKGFRNELMHALYPILALPQPSLYVLRTIAAACEYADMEEMFVDNADYIVNSLNLAFVTLDITPRTPKILGLLVQLAPNMVDLIDDVVDTFFDVLDDYHQYEGIVDGIFSGLSGVVTAVSKQKPQSAFQKVMETIQAPIEDKLLDERFEEVQDDESSSRAIEEESREKDSKSYSIVLGIMQKAQLFLSHESRLIKIKVLELLYTGIPVIAENEDKFLPLVHLYWPQLTRRLDDKDPFVVAAVMRVIARTVTFAGSFMRMRINDDVVPVIEEILQPTKDRRGNIVGPRRDWEGTGRRKVAEGIQDMLTAIVDDGGLNSTERTKVLTYVRQLADKSERMKKLLHEAEDS